MNLIRLDYNRKASYIHISRRLFYYMKNILKVVFVIIGALVGAGFASGKEIYSFFFIYGKFGIIGLIISSLIISMVIYNVLKICSTNNINTYHDFCNIIGNYKFSKLLNNIVNIFLLLSFYVMIAGFSSFLNQEFNVNKILGSLIIILSCFCVFQKNINGLMKISNYLIPILIIFIIYVALKNINIFENYNSNFKENNIFLPIIKSIIKAVLYACYNCVILIPVIIPISTKSRENRNIFAISGICFSTLLMLSLAVYNLLLQGDTSIFNLEMPIIGVVSKYGVFHKISYIFIIGIAIFTSAASSGLRIFKQF